MSEMRAASDDEHGSDAPSAFPVAALDGPNTEREGCPPCGIKRLGLGILRGTDLKTLKSALACHKTLMKLIGVIGGQRPDEEFLALAEEVGRLIAQRGSAVICGGLSGVMEAACKGAKEAGGLTVGVIPTIDKADANPYVDVVIATGLGTARNVVIVRSADAIIAIDGSFGTLSEISHAFEQGKKVVSLGSWDMRKMEIPGDLFYVAESPAEAVEIAMMNSDDPGDNSISF